MLLFLIIYLLLYFLPLILLYLWLHYLTQLLIRLTSCSPLFQALRFKRLGLQALPLDPLEAEVGYFNNPR